jgi:hypothetical protein
MQFICDAKSGKTWFRIETEPEAESESATLGHAVARYFSRAYESARASYQPPSGAGIERDIGLKAHISRTMPVFLTLRDDEGNGLATAMLPNAEERATDAWRAIIVGPNNRDPYDQHAEAIELLGNHFGLKLDHKRCYPYGR